MAYKSHIQTYPERIERAADILVSALCSRVIDFYKSENRTINQTVNIQPSVTAKLKNTTARGNRSPKRGLPKIFFTSKAHS